MRNPTKLYFLILFYIIIGTSALEGTWQSQSGKVITGDLFFQPDKELLLEPKLPGISYSFTKNGYWELAQYVIISNNKLHNCPQAQLIWQHGKYHFHKRGKLILMPIENDGRTLISDPCSDNGVSEYKRFYKRETLEVDITFDPIVQNYKLILVDSLTGNKKQPMWLTLKNATMSMLPTGVITSRKKKYVKKE